MLHSAVSKDATTMIETFGFAIRLLSEPDNYLWIPNWLVANTGVKTAAFAINEDGRWNIYYTTDTKKAGARHFTLPAIDCTDCTACPIVDTLAQQWKQMQSSLSCSAFTTEGCLFIFTGSMPFHQELFKRIATLIALNNSNNKTASRCKSSFLPSDRAAQLWLEILSGLSHDIRTPLAVIKGYASTLLRDDVDWDVESQKEQLNIIVEESDYLESFISKFFDSTTMNWKGAIELSKEKVYLPHMIAKVLKDSSYHKKRHLFTSHFPPGFPTISADPLLLERVIRNIVENAVNYSPPSTRIILKGDVFHDEVVISVADQGMGIAEEDLKRLFEKFYRVNNGISKQHRGMGLGLPLARQIISSHGGRIWAESKVNTGTTLFISLPSEPSGANKEGHLHEEE